MLNRNLRLSDFDKCYISQFETAKLVLRLALAFVSCLVYCIQISIMKELILAEIRYLPVNFKLYIGKSKG